MLGELHVGRLPRPAARLRRRRLGLQLVLRRPRRLRRSNPRRRDMGYHNVFDHYRADPCATTDSLAATACISTTIRTPSGKEAHRCATHWWASSDSLQQILSRRVIDRQWFPAANRPGFHVIRPDSHWFLEQFIPFDFSSQAIGSRPTRTRRRPGSKAGAGATGAGLPPRGSRTIPSHDDYQVPGACRRWIARCLNVGTRYRLLTEGDVRQAFSEAARGQAGRAGLHQPRLPRHAPRRGRGSAHAGKSQRRFPGCPLPVLRSG